MSALAASNQRIRRLRRLSGRRSARADEGAFLLEGPTLLGEALDASVALEGIYIDESTTEFGPLVERAERAAIPVHRVSTGVLADVTDAVTPRPILAVAPIRATALDAAIAQAAQRGRPLIVLVDVRDPGNLGTIIRAADASGAAGVICCQGTVDPWAPKVVRSSAGAVLHVPLVVDVPSDIVLEQLGHAGLPRIGTVVEHGESYDQAPLSGAVAIVLGNEAQGLPADTVATLDHAVTIPMEGRAESLNVAMAMSILSFEALRQRRARAAGVDSATTKDWTPTPAQDKVIRP